VIQRSKKIMKKISNNKHFILKFRSPTARSRTVTLLRLRPN
jgi:hypothetical protein